MSEHSLNPELIKSHNSLSTVEELLVSARLAAVDSISQIRVLDMQVSLPGSEREVIEPATVPQYVLNQWAETDGKIRVTQQSKATVPAIFNEGKK